MAFLKRVQGFLYHSIRATMDSDLWLKNGVTVPFLHINDLIANKKAVARPKDQLDVLELEKIRKYLDEQSEK